MGKRKEPPAAVNVVDDTSESPSKRHKKHKKHKHKKKHEDTAASGDEQIDVVQPAIKLKIKLGGQTIANTSISSNEKTPQKIKGSTATLVDGDVFKTKKKGDDTSDEEQAWLNALEAGELDDNGDLSKKKDPMLLTARQRSLLHGKNEDCLLELPTGYKATELTEEQVEKKQQRAKKRREQAQEKREKDKKQTLDRLLKKQDAKGKGGKGRGSRKSQPPGYRYLANRGGISIGVPDGLEFPFPAQPRITPKPVVQCGIKGCASPKKYSCSKSGLPLCSLACYKKNLVRNPQLTPILAT